MAYPGSFKILFFVLIVSMLSACSITDRTVMGETRVEQLDRYGYGTGDSEIVVRNSSDENKIVTLYSGIGYQLISVPPGKTERAIIYPGYYNIDTKNHTWTKVKDERNGYDYEVKPNHKIEISIVL